MAADYPSTANINISDKLAKTTLQTEVSEHLVELYFSTANLSLSLVSETFHKRDPNFPIGPVLRSVMEAWAVHWSEHPLIVGNDNSEHERHERRRQATKDLWTRAVDTITQSNAIWTASLENITALSAFRMPVPKGCTTILSPGLMQEIAVRHVYTLGLHYRKHQNTQADNPDLPPHALVERERIEGRLFWVIYGNDIVRACILKRPPLMRVEDTNRENVAMAMSPTLSRILARPAEGLKYLDHLVLYYGASVQLINDLRELYVQVIALGSRRRGLPIQGIIDSWRMLSGWEERYYMIRQLLSDPKYFKSMDISNQYRLAALALNKDICYMLIQEVVDELEEEAESPQQQSGSEDSVLSEENVRLESLKLSTAASQRIAQVTRLLLQNPHSGTTITLDPSHLEEQAPRISGTKVQTGLVSGSVLRLDSGNMKRFISRAGDHLISTASLCISNWENPFIPVDVEELLISAEWCARGLRDIATVWDDAADIAASIERGVAEQRERLERLPPSRSSPRSAVSANSLDPLSPTFGRSKMSDQDGWHSSTTTAGPVTASTVTTPLSMLSIDPSALPQRPAPPIPEPVYDIPMPLDGSSPQSGGALTPDTAISPPIQMQPRVEPPQRQSVDMFQMTSQQMDWQNMVHMLVQDETLNAGMLGIDPDVAAFIGMTRNGT